MFFNQIAHTGKVPLSFDWCDTASHKLSASGEKLLAESITDIAQNDFSDHSADELINLTEFVRD